MIFKERDEFLLFFCNKAAVFAAPIHMEFGTELWGLIIIISMIENTFNIKNWF